MLLSKSEKLALNFSPFESDIVLLCVSDSLRCIILSLEDLKCSAELSCITNH